MDGVSTAPCVSPHASPVTFAVPSRERGADARTVRTESVVSTVIMMKLRVETLQCRPFVPKGEKENVETGSLQLPKLGLAHNPTDIGVKATTNVKMRPTRLKQRPRSE